MRNNLNSKDDFEPLTHSTQRFKKMAEIISNSLDDKDFQELLIILDSDCHDHLLDELNEIGLKRFGEENE